MATSELLHQAALEGNLDELKRLVTSGMDINRVNSAGQLPLHLFCSTGWMDDEFLLDGQVPRECAEWLLQNTQDVDIPDQNGITALHMASMMSQFLVKQLLAAGADPTRSTGDGMNALHLAARARQSNIIGSLIDALPNRQEGPLGKHVNTKDEIARTPLHYACRSGRPESVSYLLAAGADPSSPDANGLTPFDACLEFEEEQALWVDYREIELPLWYWLGWLTDTDMPPHWNAYALGGVRREDANRPWIRPSRVLQSALNKLPGGPSPENEFRICSVQHTTRLGEILQCVTKALLNRRVGNEAMHNHINKCLRHCELHNLNYTKSCLLDLQENLDTNRASSLHSDSFVLGCIQRAQADLLRQHGPRNDQPDGYVCSSLVNVLLRRREYNVLERIIRHNGPFPPLSERDVCDIARLLAKHGFANLLEVLIDSKYGEQLQSDASGPGTSVDPILLVAVKRQLPNMEVVRLLVEKAGLNINAVSRTGEEAYADVDGPGVCYYIDVIQPGQNTALHECAKGFNWWQVRECLPYLLSHGADPGLRNEAGATPSEITQSEYKETFMDDAARLLKEVSRLT